MVKDLYLTKSMDLLDNMTAISSDLSKKPGLMLCKSANVVAKEAEMKLREGDEEQAYILFKKYFQLLDMVKKCNDIKKHQMRDLFGSNDLLIERMDKLERLTKSLVERYGKLKSTLCASELSQPATSTPNKPVINEQIGFGSSNINNVTQRKFKPLNKIPLDDIGKENEVILDQRFDELSITSSVHTTKNETAMDRTLKKRSNSFNMKAENDDLIDAAPEANEDVNMEENAATKQLDLVESEKSNTNFMPIWFLIAMFMAFIFGCITTMCSLYFQFKVILKYDLLSFFELLPNFCGLEWMLAFVLGVFAAFVYY